MFTSQVTEVKQPKILKLTCAWRKTFLPVSSGLNTLMNCECLKATHAALDIHVMQISHHKTLTSGPRTSHWQLHHVSLNATKHFQVEFEARKGAGSSSGGFSIDDINLSEVECPHVTMQFDDFEKLLNTSKSGTTIVSPRQYSTGGYAYRVGIKLYKTFVGVFVQLLSSKNDNQLQWPCPQRQVTFQMLDQTPNIQQHMSKQRSITTDLSMISNGKFTGGTQQVNRTRFLMSRYHCETSTVDYIQHKTVFWYFPSYLNVQIRNIW